MEREVHSRLNYLLEVIRMTEMEIVMDMVKDLDNESAIKRLQDVEFYIQMKDHLSASDSRRIDAITWLIKKIKEGKRYD